MQVRDALNLTYDVTFELSLFNRIQAGWWLIHVTARPGSISDAVAASLKVLRNVATSRIRESELARAKRAVLTRFESDAKVGPRRGHTLHAAFMSILAISTSAAMPLLDPCPQA